MYISNMCERALESRLCIAPRLKEYPAFGGFGLRGSLQELMDNREVEQ